MTRIEEIRISLMMRMGCVACAHIDIANIAAECHHLLSGGRRMGDWFTIPLCPGHHRGAWTDAQKQILSPRLLVSIADGRKAFTAAYPTEKELWETIQNHLGLAWPLSTIVPRAA